MADDGITAQQFHESDGVEDWRVVWHYACAHFRTGSFERGLDLVEAIGQLAETANHHPDIDLRYPSLGVRMTSHDIGGLSRRDADLAMRISEAARDLGIEADPTAVQIAQFTIDASDIPSVMAFWKAVLGYEELSDEDLGDPHDRGPSIWFQQMDEPRPQRNRIHIDLGVPHDEAQARVDAAVAAGGRIVYDEHAPSWWTLADPEGNEVDIATWHGRD